MRYLESQQLLIKPVQLEDIERLLEIRWDRDVMELALHEPIGMREQLEWFNRKPANDLPMSIFLKQKEGMQLIGTIGFYQINMRHQRAVLRIRLCAEVLGKGYGFKSMRMLLDYGFRTLNLRKVTSDCFSDNSATIRIKKKLGFVQEGVLRQHFYHNGAFRDADFYGLLKEDFYEATKDLKPL